jgi:tryptophanyl-tRNA synthetase
VKDTVFDRQYYDAVMKEFNYDSLEFEEISFALGSLSKEDLQRQWLCHMNGASFATALNQGRPCIAATGFGLSGIPHMGTLSQILRAIRLQRSGVPVQVVLGDLDAYNGKNVSLERASELAERYRRFILNLGFSDTQPSRLRSQLNSLTTLQLAYLIGHHMDDKMFNEAEEDLHDFYAEKGKVDYGMTYRRKLSLNLMIADFLELICSNNFDSVLVVLGIDEHKYVNFGLQTLRKVAEESPTTFSGKNYSAMYSGIIRGFHGYPKMSKSFPESGITVDMSYSEIANLIAYGETVTPLPETNVVYQMIASVSLYDSERISEAHTACLKQSKEWKEIKHEYAKHLSELCQQWRDG